MSESPALEGDILEAKAVKPTFEMFGRSWEIQRKPNPLLLAEVARAMQSGRFVDMGSLVDLFERILGPEQYLSFRNAYLDSDLGDDSDGLAEVMNELVEAATARPTE